MAAPVWVLSVDLQAKTAAFTSGLGDAANKARGSFNDIKTGAAGMDKSFDMHEAKASLALLGEQVGVSIPRHIRGFIAEIPGVGKALEMAFSSVAIIALIEVIVKVSEKVKYFWEQLGKLSTEEQKIYDDVTKKAKELLDTQIASLKAEYELQISKATGIEKDRLRVAEAIALANAHKDYVGELEKEKKHLEEILAGQKAARGEANKMTTSAPANTYGGYAAPFVGAAFDKQAEGSKEALEGLEKQLTAAENALKSAHAAANNAGTALGDKLAAAGKKSTDEWKKLADVMEKINAGMTRKLDPALFGASVNPDPTGQLKMGEAGDALKGIPSTKPIYSGTTAAKDLEAIRTSQEASVAAAEKIKDSIKSVTQQYQEQKTVLEELHTQGRLTDEEFKKGLDDLNARLKLGNVNWKEFAQQSMHTVEAALMFGSSWKDALKSIAVQLIDVIVQMTLLKTLSQGMKAGGGKSGGLFDQFLGGLFGGHFALGGSLAPGKWGIAGENGPEPIFGGTAGATVLPTSVFNRQSDSTSHNYSIDMRGSSASPAEVKAMVRKGIAEATGAMAHQLYEKEVRS